MGLTAAVLNAHNNNINHGTNNNNINHGNNGNNNSGNGNGSVIPNGKLSESNITNENKLNNLNKNLKNSLKRTSNQRLWKINADLFSRNIFS